MTLMEVGRRVALDFHPLLSLKDRYLDDASLVLRTSPFPPRGAGHLCSCRPGLLQRTRRYARIFSLASAAAATKPASPPLPSFALQLTDKPTTERSRKLTRSSQGNSIPTRAPTLLTLNVLRRSRMVCLFPPYLASNDTDVQLTGASVVCV
jgi:hypothetical protein